MRRSTITLAHVLASTMMLTARAGFEVVGPDCSAQPFGSLPPQTTVDLAPYSQPVLGTEMTWRVKWVPPIGHAFLFLGNAPGAIQLSPPWPSGGGYDYPACVMPFSPTLVIDFGPGNLFATEIILWLKATLPSDPALVGQSFYMQALSAAQPTPSLPAKFVASSLTWKTTLE